MTAYALMSRHTGVRDGSLPEQSFDARTSQRKYSFTIGRVSATTHAIKPASHLSISVCPTADR